MNKKKEIIAGVSTFLTMSYIIMVNPIMLSTPGTGMTLNGVLTATILSSFIATFLMGWWARLPYALAPGMGLNAFFTYNLILSENIPWPTALGLVFWSGALFVVLSLTPFRVHLVNSIPQHIRHAMAAGIGLFLAFIGLKNAGFIVANPVTFVAPGPFSFSVLLSFIGLLIIIILLFTRNKALAPFAFLAAIMGVSFLAACMGKISFPQQFFSYPDFHSVFFKLDIFGALKLTFIPALISLILTDLFDSLSTFMALSHASGLHDEKGNPQNIHRALLVDSLATLFSGLFGTSAATTYIESAAGIEAGGRRGFTAMVCALCFLPCLFLAPIIGAIPIYATAPVLIVIGLLMFKNFSLIRLNHWEEYIPSIMIILMIPFSFSITHGIMWGLCLHPILFFIAKRGKEVSKTNYSLGLVALVYLSMNFFN